MLACSGRGATIYAIEEMRSGKIHKWHQAIITCKIAHSFPLSCLFVLLMTAEGERINCQSSKRAGENVFMQGGLPNDVL